MNTTSVTRTNEAARPLYLRVVRKWYSWASLALTMAWAYLAFDGQIRLTGSNQLQAAPQNAAAAEVIWKASPPDTDSPETEKVSPMQPDVAPGVSAKGTAQVKEIVDQYLKGTDVVPAAHEENNLEVPRFVLPPIPADTKDLPKDIEPADPAKEKDPAGPIIIEFKAPKDTVPLPKEVRLPIDPPEKKSDEEVQGARPLEPTVVQKGEMIPVAPTPVEKEPKAKGEPGRPFPEELAKETESLSAEQRLIYSAAQNEAAAKNYRGAIERFEQLFRLRPDLIHIRNEYAGVLITAGEYARAIEQYQKLVERRPTILLYRTRLGDIYVITKDYRRAIEHYTELLKAAPNEPEYAVRLARAYVFANDFTHAFHIYDTKLAHIKPDDPRAPAALGALLLDLDMPNEALSYLINKRKQLEREAKQKEKDGKLRENQMVEINAGLVRAYARLGERQQAIEIIQEMSTIGVDQISVREVLGSSLLLMEEFELAAQVFNQVLQLDPHNGNALIGMARVYLEMQQPALARQILDGFRPGPRQIREYLMAYAIYHQRIGEYTESKQIYLDMLRRNENDHENRLSLGMQYDFVKEWEKAKAEFAKIPPNGGAGRSARRAFAQALTNQRKFLEGIEVAKLLIAEDPSDYQTIAQLTVQYAKAGMHAHGIALARGYLASNPRSEGHANAVRLALGRALLEANKQLDAVREYEILLSRPSGRSAAAYYGLARAHEKLGNTERALQVAACTVGLPGGDFRNRLILADLYSGDYDDNQVIQITTSLLNIDRNNLPTLIRLMDAQQRLSRFSGQPAEAFTTALTVLSLSPSNVRGHLALARSFAVAQNYRKAAGQYDQLIRVDPEFVIPQVERARVLYADHQYSAARSQYEAAQRPSPDEVILTSMTSALQRDPKLRAMIEPYTVAGVGGPALRKEIGRLSVSVPDADLKIALHRLVCDYDARLAEANAIHLEQDAKEWKDFRPYRALDAQQASFKFEPTNTEMLFDYGQQLSARQWNGRAIEAYGQVLQVDPTHRDAMIASERADAEMGPKLDGAYSWFRQRGRNGLASIDRNRYQAAGRIPLGDETEYLMLGYARVAYRPTDGDPTNFGNIPFARVQKRLWGDQILAYGQLNVEEYERNIRTRPTFDVGAYYYWNDWITYRAGGYLENVIENGEAMRQDIHRGGVYLGADLKPTRLWALGGQWRYAHYSDHNDLNYFDLYNELSLTLPPKQLKLVQKMYFWGYREGTTFPTTPPQDNFIFGATHPYFAPNAFTQVEFRVEWWHWLSRDYFVHSNQCWYSLQYGIAADNQLVTYHNLKGVLNYDVCTWLTVGAEAAAQLSSVYNMYSAMGFLQIRFK